MDDGRWTIDDAPVPSILDPPILDLSLDLVLYDPLHHPKPGPRSHAAAARAAPGEVLRPSEVIVAAGGKGLNVAAACARLAARRAALASLGGITGVCLPTWPRARASTACGPGQRTTRICTDPGRGGGRVRPGSTSAARRWLARDLGALLRRYAARGTRGQRDLPMRQPAAGRAARPIRQCDRGTVRNRRAGLGRYQRLGAGGGDSGAAKRDQSQRRGGRRAARYPGRRYSLGARCRPGDRARGIATVVLTLGQAGALLLDANGAWVATPPPIQAVSAVGSGDAFLRACCTPRPADRALPRPYAMPSQPAPQTPPRQA